MQADLGCDLTAVASDGGNGGNGGGRVDGGGVTAHFAYVARYEYSDVVAQSDNLLRLTPADDAYQTPGECVVATQPAGKQSVFSDRQGNIVHRVRITAPHRELIIAAAGQVRLAGAGLSGAGLAAARQDTPMAGLAYGPEWREFLTASALVDPGDAGVRAAAREAAGDAATLLETAGRVARWIYEHIQYQRGATSVRSTASDALAARRGVCQDQTHLALGMLRALGIPARYVSGLLTRQAGETHAWLEFRHPDAEAGWVPADPTRGALIEDGSDYIKFAVGRDYAEALPVSGSFVSRGSGQLDFATAEVFFDRDGVSVADALALLPAGGG